MNRLAAMATFVRVAELGSFAAAAGRLGVARSVITRQIAALEAHLGIKLMVRTTRRLTLTAGGAAYLEKCREILDLVESAEADVMADSLTPRGHLRIGVPLSFGLKRLAPLLLEFARAHPDITLATEFTDSQQNLVEEGKDLMVRITARLQPGDIARKLGTSRLQVIATPAYLARHGTPVHPAELTGHALIGYIHRGVVQPWVFRIDGEVKTLDLPFRLQANNGEALAEAAARDMGITMVPDFVAEDFLRERGLVTLLDDFSPPDLGVYALLPSNRYMPHRVRALIEFLSRRMTCPASDPG
ncbi:LysR family transcriptional regulator [Thiohalocapsa marina]|uniref:LysR family transcriptional regulator n=1 Tax=Thiohalocapsa marina TaxID=424902 RepID=A0A5M8FL19_9GAMM|nr:LysR family transcriptional regulator [Thiohalocapsa marina]KAA6181592.1 LysR family transcriptional regulator [Thiohalocapsa marina]